VAIRLTWSSHLANSWNAGIRKYGQEVLRIQWISIVDEVLLVHKESIHDIGQIPRDLAVVRNKYIPTFEGIFVMPQYSPVGIHDAGHQGLELPRLDNYLEWNAVGFEAPLSVNSGRVCLVRDWNVGAPGCNVPPNI
jgi:hypothetical protein